MLAFVCDHIFVKHMEDSLGQTQNSLGVKDAEFHKHCWLELAAFHYSYMTLRSGKMRDIICEVCACILKYTLIKLFANVIV